jgi:mannose-1-phosphate guanylyltransferase
LLKATKKLLPLDDKNIIVQPCNADTAAAMCLAAMYIDALFPESVAVFIYSDQYIGEGGKFLNAINLAVDLAAQEDKMMIIGTRPTFANVGFGYVKMGQKSGKNVYKVAGFKEKPAKPIAAKMVKSNEWLWNTGIKVWKITTLLRAMKSAAPKMYSMMLQLRVEIGGGDYLKN